MLWQLNDAPVDSRGRVVRRRPVRANAVVPMWPTWSVPAETSKEDPSKVSRPTMRVLQRSDGVRPIPRGNPAKIGTYAAT